MQPYLFPYIGYFQLISAVNQFVIHDDVQWIKGGWINRNRILVKGEPHYITLPVQKDSTLLNINERTLSEDFEPQGKRIMRQIEEAYRKAPQFESVIPLVSRCLSFQERNASAFIVNTLRECCDYLGLNTPFVLSSELQKDNSLKGQSRVINICNALSASQYINPIGGTELYSKDVFEFENIKLNFLKTRNNAYRQFNNKFVPNLSIIDLLMNCTVEEICALLQKYDLE
jgi:hypothetical protein